MQVPTSPDAGKEKKLSRTQVLERKKAIDQIIRAALAKKDHLDAFPDFHHFDRNGLSVYLELRSGNNLTSTLKQYIQDLLKENMEGPYGCEWVSEEKVKRREMVAPEARYIFVRKHHTEPTVRQFSGMPSASRHWSGDGDMVVGFVHYRFVLEEEIPVVYIYELQLEQSVHRRGLGKYLMQLIELIAHKNNMGAVMLTVQKSNLQALNFYLNKLRFNISSTSPSRVDPLMGGEKSYEILCKTFTNEAKAKLEVL